MRPFTESRKCRPAFSRRGYSILKEGVDSAVNASAPRQKRVYVKVNSDFDSTGYMQPKTITWQDGRIFTIDSVRDFRPSKSEGGIKTGGRYTVVIKGEERYLFFEKTGEIHASRFGRWYVLHPA